MSKNIFLVLAALLITCSVFSATFNETEPNGCITLVDGNDPYQTLQSGDTLFGTVQLTDNEGCLYFEYTDGTEYIEDLYALNILQTGNYSIRLSHEGIQDLDLYIMDLNNELNILNPSDCGEFTCGVTCGNPEIVNVSLNPGTYIIGVSLATVYYCSSPFDASYVLSVAPFAGGDKPVVDDFSRTSPPFRLIMFGSNFESGLKVYISGSEWQNYSLVGSTGLKLKKGNALKAMFPKDGSWVPITIVNPNNESTSIEYSRYYDMWRDAGR